MTCEFSPELLIHVDGAHIRAALEVARTDQELFRRQELKWLSIHNGIMAEHVGTMFRKGINLMGEEAAYAMLSGAALANRAVRECLNDDAEAYAQARRVYAHNIAAEAVRYSAPGQTNTTGWSTEDEIRRLFGVDSVVDALMEVRHDTARDSAAFNLGCLCLAELPELATETAAS